MSRSINEACFLSRPDFSGTGLTIDALVAGVSRTYQILDSIDQQLLSIGAFRLVRTVELANLSSMIGNVLGAAIADASGGVYRRNGPHKYPDLVSQVAAQHDIEIKCALEDNRPKGHLPKQGYYLTCRYALGDAAGAYTAGTASRGDVVWVWELRFGYLEQHRFNLSNTQGDSGKTAVISQEGMNNLPVVYFDERFYPGSKDGRVFKTYRALRTR